MSRNKINGDQVRQMCIMLADEGATLGVVAARFGVNLNTIYYHVSPTFQPESPIECKGKKWHWVNGSTINNRKRSKD